MPILKIQMCLYLQFARQEVGSNFTEPYPLSNFHRSYLLGGTLTDATLSCPGLLLKTTPPPPRYQWVSGGRYVTPEPRFRGLVLDHQLLKEPEPKNHSKRAKFDQKQQFLGGFLALAPLNLDGRAPNH